MKKFFFSIFLIGVFTAYALYVRRPAPGADVAPNPVALLTPPPTQTEAPSVTPPQNDAQMQVQGTVRIFNTTANAQALVQTTRLLTSDGKLYRLAQPIVVPAEGDIDAHVYADQNGSTYVIGSTRLTIPGLSTDLQQRIYAVSNPDFALAQPITVAAPVATPPVVPAPQPVSTPVPVPTPPPAPKSLYKDGVFTGISADAYYGYIQVEILIHGGKLTDVQFLDYPQDRGRSVQINTYAMPRLKAEAIQAQSANVDGVSGATASSGAFVQSLGSALAEARN